MKTILVILSCLCFAAQAQSQDHDRERKMIESLIDQYSLARESQDTVLLKKILTSDIDQLVSTGEWRVGVPAAILGMLRSTTTNPGKRSLSVDKLSFIEERCALVDCRYDIQHATGTRRMWSTFVVVSDGTAWKIRAIRNMLPSGN